MACGGGGGVYLLGPSGMSSFMDCLLLRRGDFENGSVLFRESRLATEPTAWLLIVDVLLMVPS
jgi:hypothetical protein